MIITTFAAGYIQGFTVLQQHVEHITVIPHSKGPLPRPVLETFDKCLTRPTTPFGRSGPSIAHIPTSCDRCVPDGLHWASSLLCSTLLVELRGVFGDSRKWQPHSYSYKPDSVHRSKLLCQNFHECVPARRIHPSHERCKPDFAFVAEESIVGCGGLIIDGVAPVANCVQASANMTRPTTDSFGFLT